MARRERLCSEQDARRILSEGTWGVLCMAADDMPYGVPLNYCYVPEDNALFFHCAAEGRKLDMLRQNPRVVFVVTGKAHIVPERLTTRYESAMAFGTASLVADDAERKKRILQLCVHLTPGRAKSEEAFGQCMKAVAVLRMDIESLSGKINAASD